MSFLIFCVVCYLSSSFAILRCLLFSFIVDYHHFSFTVLKRGKKNKEPRGVEGKWRYRQGTKDEGEGVEKEMGDERSEGSK